MRGTDVRRPALAVVAALFSLLLLTPVAARAGVISAGALGSTGGHNSTDSSGIHPNAVLLASDRNRYHAPRLIDPDLVLTPAAQPPTAPGADTAADITASTPTASAIDRPTARAPPTDRWL